MIKGKTYKATWLSRPGRSTSWAVGLGVTVTEHQWADESVATVHVHTGDTRNGTYGEYLRFEGVEPGTGQALADALAEGK